MKKIKSLNHQVHSGLRPRRATILNQESKLWSKCIADSWVYVAR